MGSGGWMRLGSKATVDSLHAANSEEWQVVEQVVAFDYTPCHYGGKRTGLLCSECNKRVTPFFIIFPSL